MPLLPVDLDILKACLGSSTPNNLIHSDGASLVATNGVVWCQIREPGPAPFEGALPGIPWLVYMRSALLAGASLKSTLTDSTYHLKCSVGSLKLSRTAATVNAPRIPLHPGPGLQLTTQTIDTLLAMLNANYVSALQVAYPEMLGITLSPQGIYSVSLQALLKLRLAAEHPLPETPQLLPEPFLRLVEIALSGYGSTGPVTFHSASGKIWTTLARTTVGTALPDVGQWLDLNKVQQNCATPETQTLDISLSTLRDKQALFSLTDPDYLELGPEGARAVSAGMEYVWDEVRTPLALRLPFNKIMDLLPLTPVLKRAAPELVHLEGTAVEAFVSTRV